MNELGSFGKDLNKNFRLIITTRSGGTMTTSIQIFDTAIEVNNYSPSISDKDLIITLRKFGELFKSSKIKNMLQTLWYLPWITRPARNLEKKTQALLFYQFKQSTNGCDDVFSNMKSLSELCVLISNNIETDEKIKKKDHKISIGPSDTVFETLTEILNEMDINQFKSGMDSLGLYWAELDDKKILSKNVYGVLDSIFELLKWVEASNIYRNPGSAGENTHKFIDVAMNVFPDDYFNNGYPYLILDLLKIKNNKTVFVSSKVFSFVVSDEDAESTCSNFERMDQLLLKY